WECYNNFEPITKTRTHEKEEKRKNRITESNQPTRGRKCAMERNRQMEPGPCRVSGGSHHNCLPDPPDPQSQRNDAKTTGPKTGGKPSGSDSDRERETKLDATDHSENREGTGHRVNLCTSATDSEAGR